MKRPLRSSGLNRNKRAGPSSAPSTIGGTQWSAARAPLQLLCLCALNAAAVLFAGCQTHRVTTSDGWPLPPTPRQPPEAPAHVKADRMVFTIGSKPDDANNNGFPDAIQASVWLFSSTHPIAIQQDGAFVFELFSQGTSNSSSKPIASWRVDPNSPQRQLASTFAGPSYHFNLSLIDAGGDRLPLERADMICRFEPADSSTLVQCDGVRTIQIGRRIAAK